MFILKKLIGPFLRPPGIFVFAALAVAAVFAARRRWRPALVAVLISLMLWLPAIRPVSNLLLKGLITDVPGADAPLVGDAIVLLGAGVEDRDRDPLGDPGVLTRDGTRRLVTAMQLHRRLGLPIITTGGTPLGESVSEAAVSARYLVGLGVPAASIIVEEQARDTRENAAYVAELCRMLGFRRVILVTSHYHLKRAAMMFAGTGLTVRPAAERSLTPIDTSYRWSDFLPKSYSDTANYIHEYLGILLHRLAG